MDVMDLKRPPDGEPRTRAQKRQWQELEAVAAALTSSKKDQQKQDACVEVPQQAAPAQAPPAQRSARDVSAPRRPDGKVRGRHCRTVRQRQPLGGSYRLWRGTVVPCTCCLGLFGGLKTREACRVLSSHLHAIHLFFFRTGTSSTSWERT